MAAFDDRAQTVSDPARSLAAITPADADLSQVTRAIYVGGAGNLVVIAQDDAAPVTFAVNAGVILPIRAKRITSATTATNIVALF